MLQLSASPFDRKARLEAQDFWALRGRWGKQNRGRARRVAEEPPKTHGQRASRRLAADFWRTLFMPKRSQSMISAFPTSDEERLFEARFSASTTGAAPILAGAVRAELPGSTLRKSLAARTKVVLRNICADMLSSFHLHGQGSGRLEAPLLRRTIARTGGVRPCPMPRSFARESSGMVEVKRGGALDSETSLLRASGMPRSVRSRRVERAA